jgi:hypothetical protein
MDGFDDTAGWWRAQHTHGGHHLHVRGAVLECSCGTPVGEAGLLLHSEDVACDRCGVAGVARVERTQTGWSAAWAE